MDQELFEVSGYEPQAVLGLIEFSVTASKQVCGQPVRRQLVVRRHYKLADPIGPCASEKERRDLGLLDSMIHINPIDVYRRFERRRGES